MTREEKIEQGICPECGGPLEQIWDRVSDDPVRDEFVETICKSCPWTDEEEDYDN